MAIWPFSPSNHPILLLEAEKLKIVWTKSVHLPVLLVSGEIFWAGNGKVSRSHRPSCKKSSIKDGVVTTDFSGIFLLDAISDNSLKSLIVRSDRKSVV